VGQNFPLRNFHRTPWNNAEVSNPIGENCGKQVNQHELKFKNHESAKISNGEAMTSELPNQSSAPEVTFAETENIRLFAAKYLRLADLDKVEYKMKTKERECTPEGLPIARCWEMMVSRLKTNKNLVSHKFQ
jgi:hypothetical protein